MKTGRRRGSLIGVVLFAWAGFGFGPVLPPDVAGVWEVVFETPMGERTYITSFLRENDGLKVVMMTPQGRELSSTARLQGDRVEWTVVVSGPMGEIRMAFKGKVEEAKMTGTVAMDEIGESPFHAQKISSPPPGVSRGYALPLIDLASETARQVVVDREAGQYLGHPTTVLLEDGRTILAVYPKGHGRGPIVSKRSVDGGLTWSGRLPVPENWSTSLETPTIHRVIDAAGKKRLIVWSGLYPARSAVSEDDGSTWSPLRPAGDWGGIVVMGFVEALKNPGHYLAMFHDDGRFFAPDAVRKSPVVFTLYKTFSGDGGLTWSAPESVWSGSDVHLCEPGCLRSPDGSELAVLLRENARRKNSQVIFSRDEGATWTSPVELPGSLTGDRHCGKYTPDGRLFISFRDTTLESPTKGDWVAWVGAYDDLRHGREGQYRVRLMKNHKDADCAYSGVEVLPDGTIVTTTYGHWMANEEPYIVSVRLKLSELDRRVREKKRP